MQQKDIMLVFVTINDQKKATEIIKELLEAKLIACANLISGLKSFYHWKGEMCEDQELLLLMKTSPQNLKMLEQRVLELHPYECPEFVAFKSNFVSEDYRNWLYTNVLQEAQST
ncbi:divalent-cation tolerance protein CutA [Candidatus Riflebacteria bacterium]